MWEYLTLFSITLFYKHKKGTKAAVVTTLKVKAYWHAVSEKIKKTT